MTVQTTNETTMDHAGMMVEAIWEQLRNSLGASWYMGERMKNVGFH